MPKKPPAPAPEELQSIDPAALEHVGGGASGSNAELTAALTSVVDSLKSLSRPQSGIDPTTMMMMMMMMGGRSQAPAAAAYPSNTIGGYAGYTIDGVYYPFK